ncbi:MAG: hypothetical protein HYY03_07540 [Chloroflexi bacterium]|nr:hypothetical protein [Chloroflexota bacterium]
MAAFAGAWMAGGAPNRATAEEATEIHGGYSATTDSCSACHRSHTGKEPNLLTSQGAQSSLCLTCHDGTGASSDVASEYIDPNVPPDDPATSSFYRHPATTPSSHTGGQTDEFAGVLNRHSECGDCHNPHTLNTAPSLATGAGWTASGSLAGSAGVMTAGGLSWKNPVSYEYELCLKCHSSYTSLPAFDKESYKMTDAAAEFNPANGSYHPVQAPGKNTSPAMQNSLAGGKLWQMTTGSTVRCTQCHGNYRLVGDAPVMNSPPADARLAPHTSRYRGLLIANYRSRELKPASQVNDYSSNDFALCYLCHSEAPFTDPSGMTRADTDFPSHGYHLSALYDKSGSGGPSTDIDQPGAGPGNTICAECHYRTHSSSSAYRMSDRSNARLVNFAPNVQPLSGLENPVWSAQEKTCSLRCHGVNHNGVGYPQPIFDVTEVSLTLAQGWNLISLPVDGPGASQFFAALDGLGIAWGLDPNVAPAGKWRSFSPGLPPSLNELTDINSTMGLFVFMDQAQTLTVSGPAPISTDIPLVGGRLNLIGYPARAARPVADVLTGIAFSVVCTYDAADPGDPWKCFDPDLPPSLNDLSMMEPGRGYFIFPKANATLHVPG